MSKNNEVLAPCGGFDSLEAALNSGCDAVYLGSKSFSARQNAKNFDREELRRAVELCHESGVLVYQAINTVVFDDQLEELSDELRFACEIGVDGIISQDLALLEIIKAACPEMPVHASTQMTVHSKFGVLALKELGFSRAVLSRELSCDIIKELCELGLDIEVFVHGALCMSVSGQCYMSAMFGSRSANRGLCAQACRLPFSAVQGNKERTDLSLKDMSYMDHIKELSRMGVKSFKIEGRMKRPEYVGSAVLNCKKAIDGEKPDMSMLKSVFSRDGFTDGYYFRGQNTAKYDMFGKREKEDVVSMADVLPKIREEYKNKYKRTRLSFEVSVKRGEEISVFAKDDDGNSVFVKGNVPNEAINREIDEEQVLKQLSKLGDTVYTLGDVEILLDKGLFVSASELNSLRRQAVEKLSDERIRKNTKIKPFDESNLNFNFFKTLNLKHRAIRLQAESLSQLSKVELSRFEFVILPIDELENIEKEGKSKDNIILALPRFTFDEKKVFERAKYAKERGFKHILATNLSHIKMAKELNLYPHGDFGLNITNSLSLKKYSELGLLDATVSFELKTNRINSLGDFLPYGIIGYGKLPLMMTASCPVKNAVGECKNCTEKLIDRKDKEFPVLCKKKHGYVEILNSENLILSDKLEDFSACSFVTLKFTTESSDEVLKVIDMYEKRLSPEGKYTRGLYYRGII